MRQTNLDESFPTIKLHLYGHDMNARKEIKKYRVGLIEVAKVGFICN